jgi:hypothetical protein
MQKVDVTDIPPLKGISPPRFEHTRRELWAVYSEFFFMLPGSFVFSVVTPLYLAHLDDLATSHSFCSI